MISFIETNGFFLATMIVMAIFWLKNLSLERKATLYKVRYEASKADNLILYGDLDRAERRNILLTQKAEHCEKENFDMAFENEELKTDRADLAARCVGLARRIAELEHAKAKRTLPVRRKVRRIYIRRPKPKTVHRLHKVSL